MRDQEFQIENLQKNQILVGHLTNIGSIINQNFEGKYILIFPFCSPKLYKKKWPYYKDLISLLKRDFGKEFNIAIAPGPNEIDEAKKFDVNVILNNGLPLNINELISLINNSSYIVSNDTGPAHICAHLNKKGWFCLEVIQHQKK